MTNDDFTKKIVCTKCKGALEYRDASLYCRNCNVVYNVNDGIYKMFNDTVAEEKEGNIMNDNAEKRRQDEYYSMLAESLKDSGFARFSVFLNVGYVANSNRQLSVIDISEGLPNRRSIKLSLELIGDCNINAKSVLEVGCGRGGNVATMNKFFVPASIIGLDICYASVKFCKSNNRFKNTFFINGDAENLPFSNNSFDVVFNLESSSNYPNIKKFYNEVHRVLNTGGYFLYGDLLPKTDFDENIQYLKDIGFELEICVDITSNVLLSCDSIAEDYREVFMTSSKTSNDNPILPEDLETLQVVPGTKQYDDIINGITCFRILRFQKKVE